MTSNSRIVEEVKIEEVTKKETEYKVYKPKQVQGAIKIEDDWNPSRKVTNS
jgi:hypothetical protein